MLSEEEEFDIGKMVDRKLGKKSDAMVDEAWKDEEISNEDANESPKGREEKSMVIRKGKKGVKKTGVAGKKRKKLVKGYFGG